MSKSRTDSDGNRIGRNPRHETTVTHAANGDVDGQPNLLMSLVAEPAAMGTLMAFFSDHGGGCLKVRRGETGADLHLTWTWSGGRYAGTYVYVRCEYWRLLFGLELLQSKVLEVEAMVRQPTPDKYADRR